MNMDLLHELERQHNKYEKMAREYNEVGRDKLYDKYALLSYLYDLAYDMIIECYKYRMEKAINERK